MTETTHTPLPCPNPWCSSDPKIYHDPDCGTWQGYCAECGVEAPEAYSEAEALTAWNTRANADARLVEALREAIGAIEDDSGLDEAICCSGHDCGCRASTHRDLLLHNLRAALSEVSHG